MAEDTPLRPPYINLFPSDWKGGTAIMTDREEWTYLQVCLHNWDKGEAMPKRLQAGLLGRNPEWAETVTALVEMDKVTMTAAGALMVPRAMASYRAALAALEKKRNSGRKGASKRWNANNNNDKNGGATSPDGANGDLVFSVPPDVWADFRKHRERVKAPMTERAERGILKRLEEIQREHGHDPVAVLDQSIRKGWRDVFPLKGEDNGARPRDSGRGLFDASGD